MGLNLTGRWCQVLQMARFQMAVDKVMAGLITPEVSELADVPEATIGSSVSHRSKRRAASSAGDSIERASKLKAARNLDTAFTKGTQQLSPLLLLSEDSIISNL